MNPTTTTAAALLPAPCPFCGGTKLDVCEASTFRWRTAFCLECGAVGPEIRIQTTGEGTRAEWEATARAEAIVEWSKRAPAPVTGDGAVHLNWTPQSLPAQECPYNHTTAQTPFGRFLLTWKGWKDDPGYGFDETPWGEVEYHGWNSVEEAQKWAELEMMRRIHQCSSPEKQTLPEKASTDTTLPHGASHPDTRRE